MIVVACLIGRCPITGTFQSRLTVIGHAMIIIPKSRKGPIISGQRKVGPNMYDVPIREITRPVP